MGERRPEFWRWEEYLRGRGAWPERHQHQEGVVGEHGLTGGGEAVSLGDEETGEDVVVVGRAATTAGERATSRVTAQIK